MEQKHPRKQTAGLETELKNTERIQVAFERLLMGLPQFMPTRDQPQSTPILSELAFCFPSTIIQGSSPWGWPSVKLRSSFCSVFSIGTETSLFSSWGKLPPNYLCVARNHDIPCCAGCSGLVSTDAVYLMALHRIHLGSTEDRAHSWDLISTNNQVGLTLSDPQDSSIFKMKKAPTNTMSTTCLLYQVGVPKAGLAKLHQHLQVL